MYLCGWLLGKNISILSKNVKIIWSQYDNVKDSNRSYILVNVRFKDWIMLCVVYCLNVGQSIVSVGCIQDYSQMGGGGCSIFPQILMHAHLKTAHSVPKLFHKYFAHSLVHSPHVSDTERNGSESHSVTLQNVLLIYIKFHFTSL